MKFKVGDKVRVIYSKLYKPNIENPIASGIYTVGSYIIRDPSYNRNDYITLCEVNGGYYVDRFELVDKNNKFIAHKHINQPEDAPMTKTSE